MREGLVSNAHHVPVCTRGATPKPQYSAGLSWRALGRPLRHHGPSSSKAVVQRAARVTCLRTGPSSSDERSGSRRHGSGADAARATPAAPRRSATRRLPTPRSGGGRSGPSRDEDDSAKRRRPVPFLLSVLGEEEIKGGGYESNMSVGVVILYTYIIFDSYSSSLLSCYPRGPRGYGRTHCCCR